MKLFVKYSQVCESHQHAKEEYGDWSASYSFEVVSAFLNSPKRSYDTEEFEVCFDAIAGDPVYVLSIIYNTGDSFGHSRGHGEVMWVFKDPNIAYAAKEVFRKNADTHSIFFTDESGNKIQLSNPASGYFETFSAVRVEQFILLENIGDDYV